MTWAQAPPTHVLVGDMVVPEAYSSQSDQEADLAVRVVFLGGSCVLVEVDGGLWELRTPFGSEVNALFHGVGCGPFGSYCGGSLSYP